MFTKTAVICLLFFLSGFVFADQNNEKNYICSIKKQYVCSVSACIENRSIVKIRIEQISPTTVSYSRCDAKGCDKLKSSIAQPGAYIEITTPGKSLLLKIYSEDLTFMETSSLGLASYISFGECKRSNHE